MNVERSFASYKDEFESVGVENDIINKNESTPVAHELENDTILLEETVKREHLLSILLADIKWTINTEAKVSYINPFIEDCIGNDVKYLIKKKASKYLTQSAVMACLIELEELIEMLRTSRNTRQRKIIVDTLKSEINIEKIEITSSAIFDTYGNVIGIQGLCRYLGSSEKSSE